MKRLILVILIMLLLCSSCESNEAPIEHEHYFFKEIVKSTCQEQGYTRHFCVCGEEYIDAIQEKSDHVYSYEYTIDLQPTYESEGERSRHCLYCDARCDIEVLPKITPTLPIIYP